MRDLKRLLSVVLLLTFLAGIGMGAWIGKLAAAPKEDARSVERRVSDWQRFFQLNATQVRRLESILAQYDQQVRRVREQGTAEQTRKIRTLQEESRQTIRKLVLTLEQQREYDKLRDHD